VPDDEDMQPVDWASIERGELGHVIGLETEQLEAERDWLTTREFSLICDRRNRSSVTRWASGVSLPADSKRPWAADAIPVDKALTGGYWRIWMPGVNESFWKSDLIRRARDELLARWPTEKGWTDPDGQPTVRCLTPLDLPAPFAAEYALSRGAAVDAALESLLNR
jgi:hypothetical protein